MSISYRSLLSVNKTDAVAIACKVLEEFGVQYAENTQDGIGSLLVIQPDLPESSQVAVALIESQEAAPTVVVERQHPQATDEVALLDPPAFVEQLFDELEASFDQLPWSTTLDSSALGAWLERVEESPKHAVLAIVDEPGAQPGAAVKAQLKRQLAGMSPVAYVSPDEAERLIGIPASRAVSLTSGCLVLVTATSGELDVATRLPATSSARQPEAAVNRIRRQVLRRQTSRNWNAVEDALRTLRLSNKVATIDSDWLREHESVEAELNRISGDLELAILEHDETLQELNGVRGRLAYIERRLQEFEQAPILDLDDELDVAPQSCVEALSLAKELLEHVQITASDDPVLQLDRYPKSPVWAGKLWSALIALDSFGEFCSHRGYSRNFLTFCDEPPLGARPFFANGVALSESDSTEKNADTRRAREFSVPEYVAPSRKTYMGAHLKIDQRGSPAPRVHFLVHEDASGSVRIFVGYVGPHLPTAG